MKLQTGGRPVGYLQSVEKLSSGLPKTNPASGREEDLNPGPRSLAPKQRGHACLQRPLITCVTTVDFVVVVVVVVVFVLFFFESIFFVVLHCLKQTSQSSISHLFLSAIVNSLFIVFSLVKTALCAGSHRRDSRTFLKGYEE